MPIASSRDCPRSEVKPPDRAKAQRQILVVKLDGIGDLALALPALRGMADRLPHAAIDLVVSPLNSGWGELLPWVRRVYVVDFPAYRATRKGRLSKLRIVPDLGWLALRLLRSRYDAAIDLRTAHGDWRGKLVTFLSRARRRIGGTGNGTWMLTDIVPDKAMHQGDVLLERLRALLPDLEPSFDHIVNVSRTSPGGPVRHILLHPGAGVPSKKWPAENWVELASELRHRTGSVSFQFIGGKGDADDIRSLCESAHLPMKSQIIAQSLREALEQIAKCDLLVGLDSAAPHLAALVGTPCVTIFSAANEPARWRALGRNDILHYPVPCSPCRLANCKLLTHLCMESITVRQVLAALDAALARTPVPLAPGPQ
ncbi:MAG: hypothetical protein QOE70_990 [Chthoniobacter sp.]|jgi:ADP-heptose:LPS heptosyltransferase|nr:hypothetical protein [Chthoniobacter sp.]